MAKTKSQRKELTAQSHQELKQTTNQRKDKKMSKVVSLKSKEQKALLKVIYSVLDTLPNLENLDKVNKEVYANYEDFILHLTKDEYRSFWDAYKKLL